MNIAKLIEENEKNGNLISIEPEKIKLKKFIDFITNKKKVEENYKQTYMLKEYKDLIFEKIYDNKDLTIIYNMKNNKNELLKSEKYSINGKLLSERISENESIIKSNYYYELNNLVLKTTEVEKENNRISFTTEDYKFKIRKKQENNEFGQLIVSEKIGNKFHMKSNWIRENSADSLVSLIEIRDLINGIVCEKKYGYERLGMFIEQKEINIEDNKNKIKELYIYENEKLKEIKIKKENIDIQILFNKDKSINRIIKDKNNQILNEKYDIKGKLIEFKINDIEVSNEIHEKFLLENNVKKYINKNQLINDTLYSKKIENKELTENGYIIYDEIGQKVEEKNNNKVTYYKEGKLNISKIEFETEKGYLKSFKEFYDENESLLELKINDKRVSLKKYKEELEKEGISTINLDFLKIDGEKKEYNQDGSLKCILKSDIQNNIYSQYNYDYKNRLISKIIIDENIQLRKTMIYKEKEECENISIEDMDKIIENKIENSLILEIPTNENENEFISLYIGFNYEYPVLNQHFGKEINISLLKEGKNITLTKTETEDKFFYSEKMTHRVEINKEEYEQLFEELLEDKIKVIFRNHMKQEIISKQKKYSI